MYLSTIKKEARDGGREGGRKLELENNSPYVLFSDPKPFHLHSVGFII